MDDDTRQKYLASIERAKLLVDELLETEIETKLNFSSDSEESLFSENEGNYSPLSDIIKETEYDISQEFEKIRKYRENLKKITEVLKKGSDKT